MSRNELEDICVYYYISREQRETEMARGLGKKGTRNYEDTGCYSCDGDRRECNFYVNGKELYQKGLERGKKNA